MVDGYDKQLGLNRFELLIDWGWFYFITKPMFYAIDWLYQHVGNFGIAILLITVIIKIVFFPLANKSYASMAKMKAVQPEMMAIRERYGDDKMKQQQALMELYKKEKINPLAGCLPILIQVPVFFALYKVLFISIEMRHAPFFGWIKDLSAPDPTNLFNLFGLHSLRSDADPGVRPVPALGVWPIIMGITMWFQMKLNPAPPDPTQKMIFDWMPLIFTFMLAIVLGRPGDLLGLEQHAVGAAAVLHHAQARRQDRAVGQPQSRCSGRRKTTRTTIRKSSVVRSGKSLHACAGLVPAMTGDRVQRPAMTAACWKTARRHAGGLPMKSRLPTSTPHWRMMS